MSDDVPEATGADQHLKMVGKGGRFLSVRSPYWPVSLMAENLDIEKLLAWHYAAVLEGLNAKRTEEGWVVVLKGKFKASTMVTFVYGRDYAEALENMLFLLESETLSWRKDKFT